MKWRLVAVFVGITVVVLAAHDIPLARHLEQVERDRIVTGLQRDAFTLAGRAEDTLRSGTAAGDPGLQSAVDASRRADGARVIVTDARGTAVVISDEEAAAGSDYSTRPEIATALRGQAVSGTRDSKTLKTTLLYVAVPVISGTEVIGAVRLTSPASSIDDRVAGRVRGLILVAGMSVVMAAAAALLLAGTISGPLARLRAATGRLAAGDLDARAGDVGGPPEVRALGASFDEMAARLDGLLRAQRDFAGDASHQLRTPLTALRLRLEQAGELTTTDPARAQEQLELAAGEVERLQLLVSGLLSLARAEGERREVEQVDVAAVARERCEQWEALAVESDVTVVVDAPGALVALAAPGAVPQIVDNYLDNALRHSPPGGTVEVSVAAEGPAVVVRVADRGPGLTDEQRRHAFDRFWRAADAPPGGSGLGLAIVAQLARASGATVALEARDGAGTVAVARFSRP